MVYWKKDANSKEKVPRKASKLLERLDSDSSLKKRCERVIYRNKYERNAPEIKSWWDKLFLILEEDSSIPPHEQKAILTAIFPKWILHRILRILSCQDRKFNEELESLSAGSYGDMFHVVKKPSQTSTVRTNKRISDKSIWDARELLENAVDVNIGAKKAATESLQNVYTNLTDGEVPKSKMYDNFFRRPPNRAAVWRTLPPLSLDEMNLNQKADAVTEKIASDFIEWLRDLGGDEELSLSVEAVIAMFEIGFHANSATSLKVEVKEMPSIPEKVADAKNLLNRAKRAVLHNEIKTDIKASKKKTTLSAFGRRLPSDMQVRPPAENYYRKWMSCDKVPEKLASMAAVWQGITHLKSTRAYCEFLIERPEIKPPKYLYDCRMLDLKYLREKDDKSEDISLEFSLPNIFTQ